MNPSPLSRRGFLHAAGTGCALGLGALLQSPFSEAWAQDALPGGIDLSTDPKPDADTLFVREARHYRQMDGKRVVCLLCPKRCRVPDQQRGFCGVRENREGVYYTVVHSRACTFHVDPIEKKPLYHFQPGSSTFSIATAGCNIECKFCQNWNISQSRPEQIRSIHLPPERLVEGCRKTNSQSLSFTYSEPIIFYEYMYDASVAAKEAGFDRVMISNGFIEPEAMQELLPQLSAVKIDLKAFTEHFYRETCSGQLQPVLDTLLLLKESGKWFEIVVLLIPTLNDSEKEIREMTEWIAEKLGVEVPVHFSRFHPTYQIKNLPPTPPQTLERAHQIAKEAGLEYVYLGNLPGNPMGNTYCPKCQEPVISRYGYTITQMNLKDGKCGACSHPIPGIWT